MALTSIQRRVCRLIAENRISSGESYVAGGVALNELISAPRISRDIDLFHDTEEALEATWAADRALMEKDGFEIRVVRERSSFVEAEVSRDGHTGRGECVPYPRYGESPEATLAALQAMQQEALQAGAPRAWLQ